MKKVLIITYYWIPSGGAGVQRWVKFTKYMRDFGWEPIIFTPSNPEYPSVDHSFEKDIPSDIQVIKTQIWEPYNIYRNMMGRKGEAINAGFISENKKSGWRDRLSIWIRGNFLIPDPRRFWVKPSIRFLAKYMTENPVDAIITTGPPHSMHLIGMGLKLKFPTLKWVADFRDPWTNIDFYKELNLTWLSDQIHHRLEKKVLLSADAVTVVSRGMKEEFEESGVSNIKIISNGFDDADTKAGNIIPDKKFSISHIGTLSKPRNPGTLWKVLSRLCKENLTFRSDLQIQLIGKVDFSVIDEIKNLGLEEQLQKIEYIPHSEAIAKQQSSQVLLLLINQSGNAKGILTGKFYEYLAAKRPVLAIGPTDGDAAEVLNETGAGVTVGFADEEATKKAILEFYEQYSAGTLKVETKSVDRFSRRSLTAEFANLLNTL